MLAESVGGWGRRVCVCVLGKSINEMGQAPAEDGYHVGLEAVLSLFMNFQHGCLAAVIYCIHDVVMIL